MKRETCEECGGKISRKNVDFLLYGEKLGVFPADVCAKCREEVFSEETSDRIDRAAKQKGLWGLSARTRVAQVGTSIAVTVNKQIADFMDLKKGCEVRVHPENKKKLVIEVT